MSINMDFLRSNKGNEIELILDHDHPLEDPERGTLRGIIGIPRGAEHIQIICNDEVWNIGLLGIKDYRIISEVPR